MRTLLLTVLILWQVPLFAQQRFIKGSITDSSSGAYISGASILTPDAKVFLSADSGIFYLHMDSSLRFFVVVYEGYESKSVWINGSDYYHVLLHKITKVPNSPMVKGFSVNRTSLGPIDIEPRRMLKRNKHEGWRLGVVMSTNKKFSKHLELGAAYAYGLRDKAHKYGGIITYRFKQEDTLNIKLSHTSDVNEQGEVLFRQYKLENMEPYRQANINYMDKLVTSTAAFAFRPLKYLAAETFLSLYDRTVTSEYAFGEHQLRYFSVTEAGMAIKYAHRETGKSEMSDPYPVVYFEIKKGLEIMEGDFDYTRYDLKITQRLTFGRSGITKLQLRAGRIFGTIPLSFLYNMRSNYGDRISFYSVNSFETMRMSEFFSDRYVSLNIQHNLGKLFLENKKASPEFIIITNAAIGNISNTEVHKNISFKHLNRGYFESGALATTDIDGLAGVVGLGGFYRYGPYSLGSFSQNFTAKLYVLLKLK
jgi:hypothetical protein